MKIIFILPLLVLLVGCSERFVKRYYHDTGELAAEISFLKLDRHGLNNLLKPDPKDGPAVSYNKNGAVEHSGEWVNGKPYNGECFILAAGDAGSWGGIGTWKKFKDGSEIK